MEHTPVKHKDCQCMACPVCDGGLFICEKCGLIEGSLTTDCPGVESFVKYNKDIYEGRIDFRDGKWVKKVSPHSPEFFKNNP